VALAVGKLAMTSCKSYFDGCVVVIVVLISNIVSLLFAGSLM